MVASHTTLPVIGLPVATELAGGLDSLLSVVQMPGDVPVATVGVGSSGPRNAGLLAVQILATSDAALEAKLAAFKEKLVDKVSARNAAPASRAARRPGMIDPAKTVATLTWVGGLDGHLRLIDQTLLPTRFEEIDCRTVETVWEAIKVLRVRGAPAIGVAAAYGVCVGMQPAITASEGGFFARLEEVTGYLASSRPTAVNLFWALDRMKRTAEKIRRTQTPRQILGRLLEEALAIHEEDRQMCRAIGRFGAELLADGQAC